MANNTASSKYACTSNYCANIIVMFETDSMAQTPSSLEHYTCAMRKLCNNCAKNISDIVSHYICRLVTW